MTQPGEPTTLTALREAAAALDIGRVTGPTRRSLDYAEISAVVGDVAVLAERLAWLLRTTGGLDASNASPAANTLRAINHHLSDIADLAQRRADRSPFDAPPSGEPYR